MKTFGCIILLSFALSTAIPAMIPPPTPVPIVLILEWTSRSALRRRNHYRRRIKGEP